MSADHSHVVQHSRVLTRLAKSKSWGSKNADAFLREITEAAAHTLAVQRVNVWLYDGARTGIYCIDHYDRSTEEHTSGAKLAAADYPIYFKALHEERAIVADDAHQDPRTREFSDGYLDSFGITSLLDAPIHSGGEVIGIVCHEHVGPARVWTHEEQRFAASLADLTTLALESAERRRAEDALRESELRVRSIVARALDAIVIIDEDSVITDWNPQAEVIFGWSRDEAIGKALYESVLPAEYHAVHRRGLRRFLEGGGSSIFDKRLEMIARNKDGREFPVELSISPVQVGESWIFSAFIRDITDRMRAEQEILHLNAQLEDRVHDRTVRLKRALTEKERLLEQLQTSSIDLLEKLRELQHKSDIISEDLERAQVIQRALLPAHPPRLEGVHVNALYRPGMNVGGDLYDVQVLADGRVAIYVADATGHGVSAAMLSVLFKQRLELCDDDGAALAPADVMRRVNARIFRDLPTPGLFLTAAYLLFDPATGELLGASAGHTPLLLRRANGDTAFLERTGPALGLEATPEFAEHRLFLRREDQLLLFTDGLTEAIESGGVETMRAWLANGLAGNVLEGARKLRELYQAAATRGVRLTRNEGRDDVTLLLLVACDGPTSFDNDPAREETPGAESVPKEAASSCALWTAEDDEHTYVTVRGRGTWTLCEKFRCVAQGFLDSGRSLTVDLRECTHLDSTFLGTLHELVIGDSQGRTRVFGPSETLQGLFLELGLAEVLASVSADPYTLPEEQIPVVQETSARESYQRLLRAHEALARLSDENRRKFEGVVDALRAEFGEG